MEDNKESIQSILAKVQDGPLHMEIHDGLSEESDSPILNTLVRNTYFNYMKTVLLENAAGLQISDGDINKFAQKIELNALKTCMSSMVYRYVMLSEIAHIKYLTNSKVSYNEKKLLEANEVTESADGLSLFLKHYVSHTRDNCPPSLFESFFLKTKTVALNNEPPTLVQEIVEEVSVKSELQDPEVNQQPTPVSSPVVQEQSICPIQDSVQELKVENMEDNNAQEECVIIESDSSTECITADSSDRQQESEDMYNQVYKEMTEMFAAEEASCSSSKVPDSNIPLSPTSIISTDRYFAHCDRNFWFLELKINSARYQQISATMYELNEKKFKSVANKIKDIFGIDGSPLLEHSPLALKKVTHVCKERFTWHVKKGLSLYYKKKRFRSADEFRILAKNIVTTLIQIDPFMGYKSIYRAINKAFSKKDVYVQNITNIQNIVSQVSKYVSYFKKRS